MHRVQYLLLLSAAKIADSSDFDGTGPFLAEGTKLKELAAWHKVEAMELLAPYDSRSSGPRRTAPYFRSVATTSPHVERFDPDEGTDDDPYDHE